VQLDGQAVHRVVSLVDHQKEPVVVVEDLFRPAPQPVSVAEHRVDHPADALRLPGFEVRDHRR
jgi:hypothetical protein